MRRPVRKGVGQWEFSPGAVFQWRIDRERQSTLGDLASVDEAEARRRKLAAEAGLAELDLHIQQGQAVSIADQEKVWAQMVGAARARMLAIPSKLGPSLAIEDDPIVCQSMVDGAIIEALTELSGFDPQAVDESNEEELSSDAVDGRLANVAGMITRIRNLAASGGVKQLGSIISECDRGQAEILGIPDEPRGPAESQGNGAKGSGVVVTAAQADHKRVGGPRTKAKSGSK